ncbi:hypothetical protein [Niabella hibiscisoli]|uniref:hypothetical protein n=1 Tax=Niabella hibiscisoli TaxID=1825928 RepID=UPI001F0EC87D|nr:hypothetical protein [Niabella hibiscisoli]MCH5718209.1 hypothetical protein [Niabella hibiscisoli]
MKKMLFLGLYAGLIQMVHAQTNSLPTTGNVGIGTGSPATPLHVVGNMTLEGGYAGNASLYTGTGTQELNRYLLLLNSAQQPSASGLKAGGILVSDAYDFASPGKNDLVVKGNVSIGRSSVASGYQLSVAGKAIATEMKVQQVNNWPDYVFKPAYRLMPLQEVEQFIQLKGHLPEIAPAKQIEKEGLELGANQALLLKKIEELTLYIIEQNKELKKQNEAITALKDKIGKIEKAQYRRGEK